jgi:hypothetical protein
MGSYLTIDNDTNDTYLIKLGADMEAVKITGYVIAAIGAVATVGTLSVAAVSAGAAYVNGIAAMAADMEWETGALAGSAAISGTKLAFYTGIAVGGSVVGNVAGKAVGLSLVIKNKLHDDGYIQLDKGESHRYGKMSLSLWQQAHCIRIRFEKNMLYLDEVNMRPIFSGATVGSNNTHDIKYWVEKNGLKEIWSIDLNNVKVE